MPTKAVFLDASEDTYVDSAFPADNYGAQPFLLLSAGREAFKGAAPEICWELLKFPIDAYFVSNPTHTLLNAYFVGEYVWSGVLGPSDRAIVVKSPAAAWSEMVETWNSMIAMGFWQPAPPTDYVVPLEPIPMTRFGYADVTALAARCISAHVDYGLVVKFRDPGEILPGPYVPPTGSYTVYDAAWTLARDADCAAAGVTSAITVLGCYDNAAVPFGVFGRALARSRPLQAVNPFAPWTFWHPYACLNRPFLVLNVSY